MSDEVPDFNADDYKKYKNFVVSEVEEGVIHVQFNNPKSLNSFAEQTWRDYDEILTSIDKHPNTNVILISSLVPKSFSTGLDLKQTLSEMGQSAKLSDEERKKRLHSHIQDFQYCIGAPARINTPTIGLLNGYNLGLALDISSTFSIRIATADARFSIAEIKIGIPADIGVLQRLPALVNNKALLYQYALTGEFFNAEDALRLGFVTKIVPDLEAGYKAIKELGEKINNYQQWAIKGTKKSIQDILNGKPTYEGLRDIAEYNSTNIDGRFLEAIAAVKL